MSRSRAKGTACRICGSPVPQRSQGGGVPRTTCSPECRRALRRAQYVPKERQPTRALATRLWSRIRHTPQGCWEFTGYCHPIRGYGQLGRGRRSEGIIEAHRAAWEITYGPIPEGRFVCHVCDNPPCCNPAHLFLGTHHDNMRDMRSKGRGHGAAGLSNSNARLTAAQVIEVRRRYVPAIGIGFGMARRSNARELAREFGISEQYVGQLAKRAWRRTA